MKEAALEDAYNERVGAAITAASEDTTRIDGDGDRLSMGICMAHMMTRCLLQCRHTHTHTRAGRTMVIVATSGPRKFPFVTASATSATFCTSAGDSTSVPWIDP